MIFKTWKLIEANRRLRDELDIQAHEAQRLYVATQNACELMNIALDEGMSACGAAFEQFIQYHQTNPDPGDSPCAPSSPPSPQPQSESEPAWYRHPNVTVHENKVRPPNFWRNALTDPQPPTPNDDSSSETKPDDDDS